MARTVHAGGGTDTDTRGPRGTGGAGWLSFAAVLFRLEATFDSVYGLTVYRLVED